LQPGEQSTLRADKFDVRQVDVSNVVTWTEGKFSFSGKEFKQIMDEVSRWYDLQVIYQGGVPKDRLVGDAYRHESLSTVLDILNVTEIKYKLSPETRELVIL